MLSENVAERVAAVLKAVGHPVRLQIVALLEGRELCVGDIVKALGAKPAMTSQQLTMMRDKHVLACRRDGAKVYYRIANPKFLAGCRLIREGILELLSERGRLQDGE